MRLGSARGIRHGDEVLTLSQRIPLDTANPVRYRFRARSETEAMLQFSLCRKHLLYPEGCTFSSATLKGGGGWQTIEGVFADPLGGLGQPPRLAAFSISNRSRIPIDLDDFELLDARLEPLLKNGEFERGMDFWFFTSDRDHLPWHAKNLFVHTFVEQGALGLGVLLLALASAFVRLLRQPTRLQTHAATLLAALVGFSLASADARRAEALLGGLGVGAVVVAVWWVSGRLGHLAEHPLTLEETFLATNSQRMESLSFVAPVAYTLDWLILFSDKSKVLTLGIVSTLGVVVGSAGVALATRSFRWEGFGHVEDTANHLVGALLMGIGGVTAMGCTVGQGLSGVSTLALGSFIALSGIIAGAVLALRWQVWRLERSL